MTNEQARRFLTLFELGYVIKWNCYIQGKLSDVYYITDVYCLDEDGCILLDCVSVSNTESNRYSQLPVYSLDLSVFTFYKEVPEFVVFDKFNPDFTETSIVNFNESNEVLLTM